MGVKFINIITILKLQMKLLQENLDKVLEIYTPECRYLKEVSLNYPVAQGVFKLGNTFYSPKNVEHMTAIEVQLCLNQLCFSAFGSWLPEGKFNKSLSFNQYLDLMKENMFIIESNIRFRKPICTNGEIKGQIEITNIKKHGGLYICNFYLSFYFSISAYRFSKSYV